MEHKAKLNAAKAQAGDVAKAVEALKSQFAGLKKQKNDLKKQQEALDKQITAANNSLGSVGQLVDQAKKNITDIIPAIKNILSITIYFYNITPKLNALILM